MPKWTERKGYRFWNGPIVAVIPDIPDPDVDRAGMPRLTGDEDTVVRDGKIVPSGMLRDGTIVGKDSSGRYVPATVAAPPYTATPPESWDELDEVFRLSREKERQTHVGFPVGGVDLDIHYLLTFVQGSTTNFAIGAQARLRDMKDQEPKADSDDRYRAGYEWADRMVEARALLAYIEEGDP